MDDVNRVKPLKNENYFRPYNTAVIRLFSVLLSNVCITKLALEYAVHELMSQFLL